MLLLQAASPFLPQNQLCFGHVVHYPPQNPLLQVALAWCIPAGPKHLRLTTSYPEGAVFWWYDQVLPHGHAVTVAFPFPCSGFLRGECGAQPQLIAFHPCFKKGALLTVVSAVPSFGSSFGGSPSLSLREMNPVAEQGRWKNLPTVSP